MWTWALEYCGYLNWFHSCILLFIRYKYFRFSSRFPVDRSIMGCRYTHHWTERPWKCRNRRRNFVDRSLLTQVIAYIQNTDIFRTRIRTPAAILDSRIGIGKKFCHHFVEGPYLHQVPKAFQYVPRGFGAVVKRSRGGGIHPPPLVVRVTQNCLVRRGLNSLL